MPTPRRSWQYITKIDSIIIIICTPGIYYMNTHTILLRRTSVHEKSRTDSLVSTYILYPLSDLGNLTPGANKKIQCPNVGGCTGYAGCQHKTKCLNTNQKVYFEITNTFLENVVFIYYSMCTYIKILDTLYNSLTHITQYPIRILKFYSCRLMIQ